MSPSRLDHHGTRASRIEMFEPRLVMSAQGVADFELGSWQNGYLPSDVAPPPQLEVIGQYNQTVVSGVRTEYGFTGDGQTVVVIDTGIAYDHLAFGGYGTGQQIVGGWDFAENDSNPYDDAWYGAHGTHVAGIIGSQDATHMGVAPGVDLVSLRVFNDQGEGYFDWIEQALRWVYDHRNAFENPITTVNLSIGSEWNASTIPSWAMLEDEFAQLEADGIFISVAAGNAFTTYNTTGVSYPAASSYVVPVASVDSSGQLSYFSQRDSRVLAAPGSGIWSAVPDYVGDFDGRGDDWAQLSGTSMASPYVAGATVLVRQALEFVGTTTINQDIIYDWLRNTADSVYDPHTNQSYARINLQRAIDAIMPEDDFASNWQSAYVLGTIGDRMDMSGLISALDDRDYFEFTAAANGRVTLGASGTHEFIPTWELMSAGGSATKYHDATLSFDVVAGQNYVVGLASSGGLGYYTLDVSLESTAPPAVDWGAVTSGQIEDVTLNGGAQWYTLSATRDGLLSVEALGGGNVALEIYDESGNLAATGLRGEAVTRLDVNADAGQAFRLRVVGDGSTDFRLANLVSLRGDAVAVGGTSGDDVFTFFGGETLVVSVNGTEYQLASKDVRLIEFQGQAGNDQIVLTGSKGADWATVRPGEAQLRGDGYTVRASGTEVVTVHGGGGTDRAFLYDSAGNDTLAARSNRVTLTGAGFSATLVDFVQVQAYASTGYDVGTIYDTTGNDLLVARGETAQMSGTGYRNYLRGFDSVRVFATEGLDKALIFHARGAPDNSTGPMQLLVHGFDHYAHRFEPTATTIAATTAQENPGTGATTPSSGGSSDYVTVDSSPDEVRAKLHDAMLEEVPGQADPLVPPVDPSRDEVAWTLAELFRRATGEREEVDDYFDRLSHRA